MKQLRHLVEHRHRVGSQRHDLMLLRLDAYRCSSNLNKDRCDLIMRISLPPLANHHHQRVEAAIHECLSQKPKVPELAASDVKSAFRFGGSIGGSLRGGIHKYDNS